MNQKPFESEKVKKLEETLKHCREKFECYRVQHVAKNTPDSLAKAEVNAEMVKMIDDALSIQVTPTL